MPKEHVVAVRKVIARGGAVRFAQSARSVHRFGHRRVPAAQSRHRLLKLVGEQQTGQDDQQDEESVGDRVAEEFDARLLEELLQLRKGRPSARRESSAWLTFTVRWVDEVTM